jgi:DNA-binding NarL/FixJ family response regulator
MAATTMEASRTVAAPTTGSGGHGNSADSTGTMAPHARPAAMRPRRLADVHIVILTTFELDEYIFEAIRSGASGFLVKDTEPAELVKAVRTAAAGDSLLSPRVTRRLIEDYATRSKPSTLSPALDVLTNREREVMVLVAAGLTNDEIAQRLVISPTTARTHVSRAMTKLGARDRAQLVVYAYETGLVAPGWNPWHPRNSGITSLGELTYDDGSTRPVECVLTVSAGRCEPRPAGP